VDFAGYTNGDPNALIDLTRVPSGGKVYKRTVYDNTLPHETPILVAQSAPKNQDVATAVNMDVISAVVSRQIVGQIRGTPVTRDVKLTNQLSVGYTTFDKPLRGREDGLAVRLVVSVRSSVTANVLIVLQPYHQVVEIANRDPDGGWHLLVGYVDVDLPWEVDFAIGILSVLVIFVSAVLSEGLLAPIALVALTALTDGVLPATLENIEAQTTQELQKQSIELPSGLSYLAVTSESIDAGMWLGSGPQTPEAPRAVISTPNYIAASDYEFSGLSVQLRPDFDKLVGDTASAHWEILRTDTWDLVVSGTKAYRDPDGNGVSFRRRTRELYAVEEFLVRCKIEITLDGQTGQLWTGEEHVWIADYLDRKRKFVQWGPHRAYFKNAGTNDEWWTHVRLSKIHRTSVEARCLAVRNRGDAAFNSLAWKSIRGTLWTYFDTLDFFTEADWAANLTRWRHLLCDYCFFGGPDKKNPLPYEDWP
jgi:hypothetical protein